MVGPCAPGAMLTALYCFSCAAGAAAAGGQAGQREPGCSPKHHREVHLPPQVQEGEHPKPWHGCQHLSVGQGLWAQSGQKEGLWWVAVLRVGEPALSIFPEMGEECKIQNWCFNILWGSRADAVV